MNQIRFSTRPQGQSLSELKLCFEVPHFCRFAKPDHGLDLVREDAKAIFIFESELKLGRGHSAIGGLPEQLQGCVGRGGLKLAGFVQTGKTILSLRIATLGSRLDPDVSDLSPFPSGPFGRLAQPLVAQRWYLLKHTMHTVFGPF
jgi:hypothetical protein